LELVEQLKALTPLEQTVPTQSLQQSHLTEVARASVVLEYQVLQQVVQAVAVVREALAMLRVD
jgi:hypothetical protein